MIVYLIYTPVIGIMVLMGYAFNPIVEEILGTKWRRTIIWFIYQLTAVIICLVLLIYKIE